MLCQYVLIQHNINLYVMVLIHLKIKCDGKKSTFGFSRICFCFQYQYQLHDKFYHDFDIKISKWTFFSQKSKFMHDLVNSDSPGKSMDHQILQHICLMLTHFGIFDPLRVKLSTLPPLYFMFYYQIQFIFNF